MAQGSVPVVPAWVHDLAEDLEEGDHALSLDEWGDFLSIYFPEEYAEARAPGKPAVALPGSAAKIEAMRQRASRGQGLWHDEDPKTEHLDHIAREISTAPNGRVVAGQLRLMGTDPPAA